MIRWQSRTAARDLAVFAHKPQQGEPRCANHGLGILPGRGAPRFSSVLNAHRVSSCRAWRPSHAPPPPTPNKSCATMYRPSIRSPARYLGSNSDPNPTSATYAQMGLTHGAVRWRRDRQSGRRPHKASRRRGIYLCRPRTEQKVAAWLRVDGSAGGKRIRDRGTGTCLSYRHAR